MCSDSCVGESTCSSFSVVDKATPSRGEGKLTKREELIEGTSLNSVRAILQISMGRRSRGFSGLRVSPSEIYQSYQSVPSASAVSYALEIVLQNLKAHTSSFAFGFDRFSESLRPEERILRRIRADAL